ncbi:MAG TPA: efflux RND transporter periplasmic adaptor subunit [Burkholderiaceae bacterium]
MHTPRPTLNRPPARRASAALTLALSLAAAVVLAACGKEPPAAEPVHAVRTMTVGQLSGATLRDYAGEVHARIESRLAFRVGGKIVQRPVNLGDRVKGGQALAAVDPADLRYGQDAARAGLAAAKVNYEQTAADYKRYQDLRAQGFISAAELERRNSGLEAARAQFDQARAQAGLQTNQAAYAALTADAPGVITAVWADVGAVVGAGTPVVSLAHDGPRDVVFAVPEDQLPVFRKLLGKPGGVSVTVWGGNVTAPATVREVAAAADPASRTFQVKADLPAGTAELGQTATVHVELAPADGKLRLPMQAVAGTGTQSHVWVLDKSTMKVREQPVVVLRPEGDTLVIDSGLKTGDTVVTAGAHVLSPGQQVTLYVEPTKR